MIPASPYLTAKEAAVYLRIVKADGSPNMGAFYCFRYKTKLRAFRRGGLLLFKVADLDGILEDEQPRIHVVRKARA